MSADEVPELVLTLRERWEKALLEGAMLSAVVVRREDFAELVRWAELQVDLDPDAASFYGAPVYTLRAGQGVQFGRAVVVRSEDEEDVRRALPLGVNLEIFVLVPGACATWSRQVRDVPRSD